MSMEMINILRLAASSGTILTGKGCASHISPLSLDAAADLLEQQAADNARQAARIAELEAAMPVTCKDCLYGDDCICIVCESGNTVVCKKLHKHVKKDEFCSYGKRKDGK